ncbi:MAG: DUF3426 domain-containing protein [Pseudomonadales bacterium]|jgi:predicted Zn finger-like uncharacterized protein|nr:DUF3426 domain-containing protein [Pseudomonadales bacterium]
MASLLTQCPHCHISFRVNRNQLALAQGQVRCGSCLSVFSAPENEIRVKTAPAPPLLDQPLSDKELRAAIEYHEYDNDDDEDFEDDESADVAELEDEELDDEQSRSDEEDSDEDFEDEDEGEPEDAAELDNEEPEDGEEGDSEDDDQDEDAEEPEDEEHEDHEPSLREPVLNLDDDMPSFSAFSDGAPKEPGFSALDGDDDEDYPPRRSRSTAPLHGAHAASDEGDDDADDFDEAPAQLAPPPARRGFFASLLLNLGLVALVLLLALQLINANLERLSQNANFELLRPFVCGLLDCPTATTPAPSPLSADSLVVRIHPTQPNALEVSATLRNNGAATQPLPNIELIFRDTQDVVVASRVFTPQQYLPPESSGTTELPSQRSLQLRVEIVNPGFEALNYELVLLPPEGARIF